VSERERIAKTGAGLFCAIAIAAVVTITGQSAHSDDPVVSVTRGPGGTAITTRDGAERPKNLDEAGARIVQLENRLDALEKQVGKPVPPPPPDTRPPLKQAEFIGKYVRLRPTFEDRYGEHPNETKAASFRKFQKEIGLDRKVTEWPCTFFEIPPNQGRGVNWIVVNCDSPAGPVELACFLRHDLRGTVDDYFEKFKRGKRLVIVSAKMQEFASDHPLLSDCTFDDPDNSWRAKDHK
jgi:hypothetical protein